MMISSFRSFIIGVSCLVFSSCLKEPTVVLPKSVQITSFSIIKFPESNSQGNPWDGALQGSYPDIYFQLRDINSNVLFTLPNNLRIENARNADLPHTWNSASNFISLDNLDQGISAVIYDYESLGSDEYMGGVKTIRTFKDLVEGRDLPSKMDLSFGEYSFELGLQWAF